MGLAVLQRCKAGMFSTAAAVHPTAQPPQLLPCCLPAVCLLQRGGGGDQVAGKEPDHWCAAGWCRGLGCSLGAA